VRLTRRVDDVVVRQDPEWLIRPPAELVAGRRLLVVDEISGSGQTLQMVKAAALEVGAAEVRCAVLYAHSPGVAIPDYIGLISDALLLNPWDREILQDGQFTWHPEYAQAMAQQGLAADDRWLVGVEPLRLAKP
jgi:hypoxanthine phosphoribosyltransferase